MISSMPGGDNTDAHLLPNISDLPDGCLAYIFKSLDSLDLERCSFVSRRWLRVEGQNRHRLILKANSDLPVIPYLFTRFDAVTTLTLKYIKDDALVLLSLHCRNLTCLKLRDCLELTDAGIIPSAVNFKGLKKLSCHSCNFGVKGMNGLLDYSSSLEELSVKCLRGFYYDEFPAMPVGPGVAASSLKTIYLKDLYNGQSFLPLIFDSKNLKTLKITYCSGDWNNILQAIAERVGTGLVELHLITLLTDVGLDAISKCSNLEILHLSMTSPECTTAGLVSIANHCKLLRRLHMYGWKIGEEGLIAIAKQCSNLEVLVLIAFNPTSFSLDLLATNCQNLERLAVCASTTFGDTEISCIASKCKALKNLCIIACSAVTDLGMKALSGGCPNLVELKVRSCKGVTRGVAIWLKERRVSLAVNLDTIENFQPFRIGSFFGPS
ncbi:putative F-box/LRR-repeat protein 8 [Macadamia integrifolia]|uniref:putative F-box/LRR-repeat protein 8 n=1 Tax=Macadamia integrifolia TaxID=60698 RepID=UPI001C4EB463|nr:putative F-box/LRR-repeat protein 8 [Macadamia integrifolia]